MLAGVDKGDRVICQSYTFAAPAFAVKYLGAFPVFIDSEQQTGNIDPGLLETAILQTRPKAVIINHSYGYPALMDQIENICRTQGVKLIEDAAGALGSKWGSQHLGTFGDFGIYSFNYNKIVTTYGGGALMIKTEADYRKAIYLMCQAKASGRNYYLHHQIGYNFMINGAGASLGCSQIGKLDSIISKKGEINRFYREHLTGCGIKLFEAPAGSMANHWLNAAMLPEGIDPEIVISYLAQHQVECRRAWKPLHTQPVFSKETFFEGNNCEQFFRSGILLPSGTSLGGAEMSRVCDLIKKIVHESID